MKVGQVGFFLRRAIANRGVIGTLTVAPKKIMGLLSREPHQHRQFNPVHPFDAEFGTDTSGLILAEELQDSHRRRSIHNTGFYATAPSMFRQALARLELDYPRFTFVDLGAGKGRILMLASNLPFQKILGVEFIPRLHAIAERNIAMYHPASRQCQDVQCILSDVQEFVFPLAPLVIFMWHPFTGPVLERVMANLDQSLRSHPREVFLVYLKPNFEHVVEKISALKKFWDVTLTMSEEDFGAYIFPEQSERCVAYRTQP